jgi:hypothetical protein
MSAAAPPRLVQSLSISSVYPPTFVITTGACACCVTMTAGFEHQYKQEPYASTSPTCHEDNITDACIAVHLKCTAIHASGHHPHVGTTMTMW